MLHAIAFILLGVAAFISSLFGGAPAPQPTLGAALPSGTAVFETSLQSRISSTDASMTLVSNSVRGGSSLSVEEGRTQAEYVCGTVSGTSVTSLTRGDANVKITDFPLLQILRNGRAPRVRDLRRAAQVALQPHRGHTAARGQAYGEHRHQRGTAAQD